MRMLEEMTKLWRARRLGAPLLRRDESLLSRRGGLMQDPAAFDVRSFQRDRLAQDFRIRS